MTPFMRWTAVAAPLPVDNVDTDQIIPGRYLKTVTRTGLGAGLFAALRGTGDFVLDRPAYADAGILIAGANFGCGSSREHAPWALLDFGIRCVIATGFADIFHANSINCGLLPALVAPEAGLRLMDLATRYAEPWTVDLAGRSILVPGEQPVAFTITDRARERLLAGLDPIAETLLEEDAIAAFERGAR